MKGKKEVIILAAIIMVVVAYLIWHPTDRTSYELPVLSEIANKEITKIEITSAEKSIDVHRKGDEWLIGPNNFPADAEKIKRMLDTVSNLILTAMVSESKSDQRYDLTPEKRIHVKAFKGDDLLREFYVGKAADTFRHTFVKIAGDDRVFHAKDNSREQFEASIDALRNKQVMAFKVDEVKSFKITKDEKTTAFKKKEEVKKDTDAAGEKPPKSEKNDTTWVTDEGNVADSSKIKAFLSTLSDLQCKKYLDVSGENNLEDPVVTIELSGTKEYELFVYAASDKKGDDAAPWPAKSSENNYPFLLVDWKAKDIVKAPADLMPDQPKPDEKNKEKDENK